MPRASYVVILHFAPCICHERVSLRRPFEYASTPSLSFIIHYSAVFIAPIGYYRICIYIYSISISRVSTTYFHDAGIREVEGKEVEKRKKGDASYLEISMDGNLIFFFPSFSLFPRVPLCSIPVKLSRPLFNRGPNENKAG